MSEMREQLERERREYLNTRYPGDLASDVLGRPALSCEVSPRRRWRIYAAIGSIGAMAAAVLFLVSVQIKQWSSVNNLPIAIVEPSEEASPPEEFSIVPKLGEDSLIPPPAPSMPSAPSTLDLPSPPAFPSLSNWMDSTTETINDKENT